MIAQCYSNEYWWITRIPEDLDLWQLVEVGTVIIIVIPMGIIMTLVPISGKALNLGIKTGGLLAILLLTIGIAASAMTLIDSQEKLDKAKTYAPGAYFGNDAFTQETLESIQEQVDNDTSWLLYIGRSDCSDCKQLESTWSRDYSLNKTRHSLSVYDTTLDRNGDNQEEMKLLLDSWEVDSVPCVIKFTGNNPSKIWKTPNKSMSEIEKQAEECTERASYINAD